MVASQGLECKHTEAEILTPVNLRDDMIKLSTILEQDWFESRIIDFSSNFSAHASTYKKSERRGDFRLVFRPYVCAATGLISADGASLTSNVFR